jgi:hypothetical protein
MSSRTVEQWTDARLDDLAAALHPIPPQVAALSAKVEHLDHLSGDLQPVPAQLAVLTGAVERLTEENRHLREELAAMEREMIQVAWGLVAALVGAATALITALV